MNATKPKLITIDGPAGSGKSTVSRLVAKNLGWMHLNTGSIYRTLALMLHELQKPVSDSAVVDTCIQELFHNYSQHPQSGDSFLSGRNISEIIRSPLISEGASKVAKDEHVRKCLLPLQRQLVMVAGGAVVDGRDMGTVVFPDCPLKIYLTATPEQRGKRRQRELHARGEQTGLEALVKEIAERDERDANREIAPMKPADDAILIDSTEIDPDGVVALILKHARERNITT